MKGQFMVLSAVIVGLTMITVGAVISDIQGQTFSPEDTSYQIRYLGDEAEAITSDGPPTQLEIENYRDLVDEMNYRSETVYWQERNCFNVTLSGPDQQINLECLPDGLEN